MIELRNISYSRRSPERQVLNKISLQIPAGQWVSIAGPNGSGKSTLLRMLNGLLRPDEGEILIAGVPLTKETADELRSLTGTVFQNPENQFIGQTVLDDIVFGLENRCQERSMMLKLVDQYAKLLDIADLLERHPATLSGGQMQRAALAAVLAMEPRILLFDEATSMLDEAGRQAMLDVLSELHQTGRYTIVSITHDTDEMLASDRVIGLYDGSIAYDGAPDQLMTDAELTRKLRLVPPYMQRLIHELRLQGLEIGEVRDEKELMDAL